MAPMTTTSSQSAAPRPPRTGRLAGGMTLMELMVSVAILAGMIAAFNLILSRSQQIVSDTQKLMRGNATTLSIAQIIRRDIGSITRYGFMDLSNAGQPMLIFTTAGAVQSATGDAKSNASLVCYRLAKNAADGNKNNILCRQAWVLGQDKPNVTDDYQYSLADIHSDPTIMSGIITGITGNDLTLSVPPANYADLTNLWQVLSKDVTGFDIRVVTPSGDANSGQWTHNSGNDTWPTLIRFKFTVPATSDSGRAGREPGTRDNPIYEIICAVGQ
jgi:prepilin-type N-terminal cleavage/methylation domain-containing protein